MTVLTYLFFAFTIALLGVVIVQIRSQRLATQELINDNRIRTRLYQDADESTTFILSRTIQNISAGTHDPSLQDDSFALKVIRELVKRKVPKQKWLELQTNERLVHEVYQQLRKESVG